MSSDDQQNPFYPGQKVVCVVEGDHWQIQPMEQSKYPNSTLTPEYGEVYEVAELHSMYPAYMRILCLDHPDEPNWWHYNGFAPVDDISAAIDEVVEEPAEIACEPVLAPA